MDVKSLYEYKIWKKETLGVYREQIQYRTETMKLYTFCENIHLI